MNIAIKTPAAGKVSGQIPWEAVVSGGIPDSVEFRIDAQPYVPNPWLWVEHHAPYVYNGDGHTLDTTKLPNGVHKLGVRAIVGGKNVANTVVYVTVANQVAPPPPPTPATGWEEATAYTLERPPFTASRKVNVSTVGQLASAISALQPGDLVTAVGDFPGSFYLAKKLRSPALFDFSKATFPGLTKTGLDPVFTVEHASNIRIFGGDVQSPLGNAGCVIHGDVSDFLWWNAKVGKVGGGCFGVYPDVGPHDGIDLHAELYGWGVRGDVIGPLTGHPEPLSGIQGAILADSGKTWPFKNVRVAFDIHDSDAGNGFTLGTSPAAEISAITAVARIRNMNLRTQHQTGGSGFVLWGAAHVQANVAYLECDHLQGRAVDAISYNDGGNVTIHVAKATNCCLNPSNDGGARPGEVLWQRPGIVYSTQ